MGSGGIVKLMCHVLESAHRVTISSHCTVIGNGSQGPAKSLFHSLPENNYNYKSFDHETDTFSLLPAASLEKKPQK